MKKYNIVIVLLIVIFTSSIMVTCTSVGKFLEGEDVTFDDVAGDIESIKKFEKEYKALLRKDFTEQEKYYIGRSTSAYIFKNYPLVEDEELTKYVNKVGQTVALASEKSTTYNGYRFCVFKDKKPNAYATSGGMVLVSTGILSIMSNEDELAAVLAHEIEHVVRDHPTKAVKSETKKKALSNIAKYYAGQALDNFDENIKKFFQSMSESFDAVMTDIVDSLDNGYERKTEFEADSGAVMTMHRAGYNVEALISIVGKLPSDKNKSHYGSVHPSPGKRISAVKNTMKKHKITPHKLVSERTKRFLKEISKAGIKK